MAVRIGIIGYGNLAKGVECAVNKNSDMELKGVFTRRDPSSLKIKSENVPVYSIDSLKDMKDDFDVMILCGGSATDLPKQTQEYVQYYNVIDSFDTHAKIPEHFASVDANAVKSKKVAIISCGWDPGMFSLTRLYSNSILPDGKDYTFWGKGVSQGHSDAIRRIDGVKNGKQYTIPVEAALDAVRSGSNPELTTRQKHTRECFVVPEEGADLAKIEKEIKEMPNYFADYDTTVHFITDDEFVKNHSGMAHGGFVFRSGSTGWNNENKHIIEYSIKLDSNPEFTASVLVAYARAAYRLSQKGDFGCKTVFDIAPALLSPEDGATLRKHLL
ncbi:MAG: diaminopimelate dehydrogenase [Clostridia bacterium]|nr:diaminopimelate dehydrogenase [Clostridia bacterium]